VTNGIPTTHGHARRRSELARESSCDDGKTLLTEFASKLAPTAGVLILVVSPVAAGLDTATREALRAAYYEIEVAGYCGLVDDAVAAGFRRQVERILDGAEVAQDTLNELRGKAWQAANAEWQNRGLGGFRGWCRNEGRAAAERFLTEPQ
jgi:hypothetical protein